MAVRKHVTLDSLCTDFQNISLSSVPNPNVINAGYVTSNGTFNSVNTVPVAIINPVQSTFITPHYCLAPWSSEIPLAYPPSHFTVAPSVAYYGAMNPGFITPYVNNNYQTPPVKAASQPKKCQKRNVLNLPQNQLPPLPLPGWKPLPYGLEHYWIQGFMGLFTEFYNVAGDIWTFEPTEHPPLDELNTSRPNQWSSVIHTAKVRFNCQNAGHGWTSMQGRAIFWFRLQSNSTCGRAGQILFKLYGQKCYKCTQGVYETPLWYPEEIFNALWHLYLKVGECHYGRPPTAGPRGVRTGKPLRPHRPELCQACSDGICKSASKEQSAQS